MRTLVRAVTWAHRWTGLIVGIVVVFLAITGAAIVFRPELEPVVYPHLMRNAPCDDRATLDRRVAAARSSHPGSAVTYVYQYGDSADSTLVRFSDSDQLYVDTCTARVLGAQWRYAGFFGTFEGLHKAKFARGPGMTAIGVVALALAALLVVGGLAAWWPRRRAAYILNLRLRDRARALNVHQTVGLYAALVVFVVAITAVPLSLGWARSALFVATRSVNITEDAPLPPLPARVADARILTLQGAWDQARSILPAPYRWGSIRIPGREQPFEIGMVARGAPNGEARSYVYIDPRDGRIVATRLYSSLNLGTKLYYWALAVHTGRAGGPVVRAVMLLGMLALVVVAYAGFDSYVRKFIRRRAARF